MKDQGKKKVLIYAPMALWRFHLATDLELAQRYLDEGHEVFWIACKSELPICQANPDNLKSICMACEHRSGVGLSWLGENNVHVLPLSNLNDQQKSEVDRLDTDLRLDINSLRNFEYEGSDIGMAVLSSVVSQLRDPLPDLSEHIEMISEHVRSALIVHFSMKAYLEEIQPDEVVMFNGRYTVVRPALRVVQQSSASVITHERPYTLGKYLAVKDNYPHELELGKKLILDHWQTSQHALERKQEIASAWYEGQRAGKDQGWFSFVSQQDKGVIPEHFDRNKVNFAIFVSSEEEFAALKGWENPIYESQNDGIQQIMNAFHTQDGCHFYIRVHPNLAGIDNTQTRGLESFRNTSEQLTLIEADSAVDTYALVDAVDAVITFGTTVGVEAVYMKKPSILLGRSFYEDFDGVIRPTCHADVIDVLGQFCGKRPAAADSIGEGAYIYGYYLATAGEKFRYVLQDKVGITGMVRNNKITRFRVSKSAALVWIIEKALRMLGLGNLLKK